MSCTKERLVQKCVNIRVGLDYNEEVHRSRILGEWSNMIGYEMGFSPDRVYTTTKTSLVVNFKHG